MKNQTLTGYPSIDKPWKKSYRDAPIRSFNISQKLCTMVEEVNKGNLLNEAVNFMGIEGNTWTYKELFGLANKLADAFIRYGIKESETVLVATVSGMDEVLSLLALNKIGVVSKWIDITASAKELEEAIKEDHCRIVVAFAAVIPELAKCINNTNVEKVLYSSPDQFIRKKIIFKSLLKLKKLKGNLLLPTMPSDSRYVLFKDFLKLGSKKPNVKFVKYDRDKPVLKIQSSGTTGKPKSIVHTDYSINASIRKFAYTDFPLYPQKVILKTAPSWVGYGLINTLALGLAYGMTVLLMPMIGDDTLLVFNNKYDVAFGVPLHYRFLSSHLSEITDMNRPQILVSGGDRITALEIETFQKQFALKGCHAPILNGAGNNEILGAGSVNLINANKLGTIGLPLYNDTISIFDTTSGEEMQYGETGEICYCSESAFVEYANNLEKTIQVKRLHNDNKIWVHSNDLGSMDEDGFITIEGRLSRIITVAAFKISANQIEEVVQAHHAVKESVAVAVPDVEAGEVPMIFIVLKEEYLSEKSKIEEEIKNICKMSLKAKAIPKYYYFIDSIPYTSNNKQNFKQLEEMGKIFLENKLK